MERLYETLKVKLTGVGLGLIMDNGDRADPRDFIALERARLAGTRAKDRTEQQLDLLEDLEYIGGVWSTATGTIAIENDQIEIDGWGNLCIITGAVERVLQDSAALFRLGGKAKTAFLLEGPYHLLLDGKPAAVADIFARRMEHRIRRRVRTGSGYKKSWIVITRPMFREWSAIVDINYFPNSLDLRQVKRIIEAAGVYKGLASYRPKHGRFDVEFLGEPNGTASKGRHK